MVRRCDPEYSTKYIGPIFVFPDKLIGDVRNVMAIRLPCTNVYIIRFQTFAEYWSYTTAQDALIFLSIPYNSPYFKKEKNFPQYWIYSNFAYRERETQFHQTF